MRGVLGSAAFLHQYNATWGSSSATQFSLLLCPHEGTGGSPISVEVLSTTQGAGAGSGPAPRAEVSWPPANRPPPRPHRELPAALAHVL